MKGLLRERIPDYQDLEAEIRRAAERTVAVKDLQRLLLMLTSRALKPEKYGEESDEGAAKELLGKRFKKGFQRLKLALARYLGENRDPHGGFAALHDRVGRVLKGRRRRPDVGSTDGTRLCQLLSSYYAGPRGKLDFYRYRVEEKEVHTSVCTSSLLVGLAKPLKAVNTRLLVGPSKVPVLSQEAKALGERMRSKHVETCSRPVRNDELYRLVEYRANRRGGAVDLSLDFEVIGYCAARYENGIIEDELLDWARTHAQDNQLNRVDLPVRSLLMRDVEKIAAPRSRICVGGVQCLFIYNTGGHYAFPIALRSDGVADSPGKWSTVPKGWHQYYLNAYQETGLQSTVLRKLGEELFGLEKLEQAAIGVSTVEDELKKIEPTAWLLSNLDDPAKVETKLAAFGFNSFTGNYEAIAVLAIHDPEWYRLHRTAIQSNYETTKFEEVTCSSESVTQLLLNPYKDWATEVLFALAEGLLALKEMSSTHRIGLQDLKLRRVSPSC